MQKNINSILNFSIFKRTERSDESLQKNAQKNHRSFSYSITGKQFDEKSPFAQINNSFYNFHHKNRNLNKMNGESILSNEFLYKKNESFDFNENSSSIFFEKFKFGKTEERIKKIRKLINKTIDRKKNQHEAIIRTDDIRPIKLNFEEYKIEPLDMAGKKKISLFMIKMLTILKNSRRRNMRRLFNIYRPFKEKSYTMIVTKYKEKTIKLFILKIEKFLLLRKNLLFSRVQNYIEFKRKIYMHLSQKMINAIKSILNLRKKEIFTEFFGTTKITNRKYKHKRNNSAFIIWVDKLSFIYFKKQAQVIKYSWNRMKEWNWPLISNDYSYTFQTESHSSKVSFEDQSSYFESSEWREKFIPCQNITKNDQIDENNYFSFSQTPDSATKLKNKENLLFKEGNMMKNKKNELKLDDDQVLNFEILHLLSSFKKNFNNKTYKNLFH